MFDTNQRTVFAEHAAKEWLNLRMQALGGIVTVAIAIIGVVCHIYDFYPLSPGMFGLALAYGLPIVANMNGLLNAITETEKEMISVERVLDYSSLPPEEADTGVDHSIPTVRNQQVTSVCVLECVWGRVADVGRLANSGATTAAWSSRTSR